MTLLGGTLYHYNNQLVAMVISKALMNDAMGYELSCSFLCLANNLYSRGVENCNGKLASLLCAGNGFSSITNFVVRQPIL